MRGATNLFISNAAAFQRALFSPLIFIVCFPCLRARWYRRGVGFSRVDSRWTSSDAFDLLVPRGGRDPSANTADKRWSKLDSPAWQCGWQAYSDVPSICMRAANCSLGSSISKPQGDRDFQASTWSRQNILLPLAATARPATFAARKYVAGSRDRWDRGTGVTVPLICSCFNVIEYLVLRRGYSIVFDSLMGITRRVLNGIYPLEELYRLSLFKREICGESWRGF